MISDYDIEKLKELKIGEDIATGGYSSHGEYIYLKEDGYHIYEWRDGRSEDIFVGVGKSVEDTIKICYTLT